MADIVQITMFGKFTIRYKDNTINDEIGRIKKVWKLIELLIANRGKTVSQDKLIEKLWGDEECENPLGALKNLVYRARTILNKLDSKIGPELIVFVRNTYIWNTEIPCVVDTEEFENCCIQSAQESKDIKERLELCQRAISLYTGEFLPKSSEEEWVVSFNAYFATLYNECVIRACSFLEETQNYDEIIKICEAVIVQYPFEEKIHRCLLEAYRKTKQYNKFEAHYSHITELFYKEFGASLSDETKNIQKEVQKTVNSLEFDLSVIREGLKEAFNVEGAYFCEDYECFKNIYRVQARMIMRTGYSIHVGLITLTDHLGQQPPQSVLTSAIELLRECAVNSLRRGDVVALYNPAQLVVMLPLTTPQDGERVLSRILSEYRNKNKIKNIEVRTMLRRVEPVES